MVMTGWMKLQAFAKGQVYHAASPTTVSLSHSLCLNANKTPPPIKRKALKNEVRLCQRRWLAEQHKSQCGNNNDKGRKTKVDQNALAFAVSGQFGEIDDNGASFALNIVDRDGLAVTRLQLSKQWQGIVIVAEAHGLARGQRIERAKNGGMAKTFGDTARVKGIKGFRGLLVASMHEKLLKNTELVGAAIVQPVTPQVFDVDQ
jgi:hypothetical protein